MRHRTPQAVAVFDCFGFSHCSEVFLNVCGEKLWFIAFSEVRSLFQIADIEDS